MKKNKLTSIAIVAVTAALTFSGTAFAAATQTIDLAKAKTIALTDAGVTESAATFTKAKQGRDDGRTTFDVKFYTATDRYDYEIDAATGIILEYDRDQTGTPNPSQDPADFIGLAKAKTVALTDAGVTESAATFTKTKQRRDDGRAIYDLAFYTATDKYHFEIDAVSGMILEYERDQKKTPANPTPTDPADYIGEAEAKAIALTDAGVAESAATFTKTKQTRDDGRAIYDIKFYTTTAKYDYEIDAVTGVIRDRDQKKTPANPTPTNPADYIGEAEAKAVALRNAGLSETQVTKLKVKLDREKNRTVYEVEFKNGGMEYEYDIDAATGAIVKSEVERD